MKMPNKIGHTIFLFMVLTLCLLIFNKAKADEIVINKTNQMLYLIDDKARVILKSKVVIGRDSRPTPTFTDTMTHIVTDPYWNVPGSLYRRDVRPLIMKYPGYMESQGLEVIDRDSIDRTLEYQANGHNLQEGWRMRQRPGPLNALGRLKFMLQDKMVNGPAIFLHDTNHPELYDADERRYSSGCVRVERWEELSALLGVKYKARGSERWNRIKPIRVTIVGK